MVARKMAASEPLAYILNVSPLSGRTIGGKTVSATHAGAPAVFFVSEQTTVPFASRPSARSVPDAQFTFHWHWPGSSAVPTVSGYGVWVPWLTPLMLSRTLGQLLNAFTVTAPPRFQWFARLTTGFTE